MRESLVRLLELKLDQQNLEPLQAQKSLLGGTENCGDDQSDQEDLSAEIVSPVPKNVSA